MRPRRISLALLACFLPLGCGFGEAGPSVAPLPDSIPTPNQEFPKAGLGNQVPTKVDPAKVQVTPR